MSYSIIYMNKNMLLVVLILAILAAGSYAVFANKSDAPSFSKNFLQCSPGELSMLFPNSSVYTITIIGAESGICHYTAKVVDQNSALLLNGPGGIDCRVPQALITVMTLDHLLGQDKTSEILAEQTKLQTDYCAKAVQ